MTIAQPTGPRIVYAGTPEFAVPALQRLIDGKFNVVAVYTQPDRPAGRGRGLSRSPVKTLALEHDIPVVQPASLKSAEAAEELAALKPDLMVVAAYGLLLPETILDIPVQGCWNIHASLLPRWRGAAPIQRAIEAGDHETGVCIMQMEIGLDTGPVFHRIKTTIAPDDTGGSVHDRLAQLGGDALMTCLQQLTNGTLPEPEPQTDSGAVYAPKLSKAEAEIDWGVPAVVLERKVRAFNPWPVTWFMHHGKRLRVWQASVNQASHNSFPGEAINVSRDGIEIAARQGRLVLLQVQPEGGRPMPVVDYLNAHQFE